MQNLIITFLILFSLSNIDECDKHSNYTGWWIYGEEQHLFKDEATLKEWHLKFQNENINEMKELYLAITEMEYFPMECFMKGFLSNDTLFVLDFEINYIQGCGE